MEEEAHTLGEAAGADLGVACGRGRAHLFKHGKVVKTIPEDGIVEAVLDAIENWDESEVVEEEQSQ